MDIYETRVLRKVVQNLKKPQSFFLDRYFPEVVEFDTEAVSFDVQQGKRRLAPFCSPLVEGKVVKSLGVKTETMKPAYVKDKRQIDPKKPLKRMLGERIGGGEMSPAEREQAIIAGELEDQLDMLTRRQELMAIDCLIDGKIVVAGEGFQTTEVDYQRAAGLSVTLLTTARWGEASVSPTANIETWATTILKESGAVPTEIVFDPDAWNLFKADPDFAKSIDYIRAGQSQVELGSQPKVGAQYKGRWGSYELFVYSDWYVDDAGVEQPMLPQYSVVIGGAGIEGARLYGAIQDPKANYAPMAYFPKSWVSEDPAVRWLMLQSAPLPAPGRVNASFYAKVR
jgi:hypothetical protein